MGSVPSRLPAASAGYQTSFAPNPLRRHSRGARTRDPAKLLVGGEIDVEYAAHVDQKQQAYLARASGIDRDRRRFSETREKAFRERGFRGKKVPEGMDYDTFKASKARRTRLRTHTEIPSRIERRDRVEFTGQQLSKAPAQVPWERRSKTKAEGKTLPFSLFRAIRQFRRTGKLPKVSVDVVSNAPLEGCSEASRKQLIQQLLIRGGIEENPGPSPAPKQASSQEKKEARREPLLPEVAAKVDQTFKFRYVRKDKPAYKAADAAVDKAIAKANHEEDLANIAATYGVLSTAPASSVVPPTPSNSPAVAQPAPVQQEAAGPAMPIQSVGSAAQAVAPVPPPAPAQPVVGPVQPAVPAAPPAAPAAPVDPAVFQPGDLRGDVLLVNADRDERLEFGRSVFGGHASVLAATIERYVPQGEERRQTSRGVTLVNKPIEIRHVRYSLGISRFYACFGYLLTFSLIGASFKLSEVPFVGDYLAIGVSACAFYFYSTYLSVASKRTLYSALAYLAIKYAVCLLPSWTPHVVLIRFLIPQLSLLSLPMLPCGTRTVSYCPHLVACLLGEYKRGTNCEVMKSTIHQKTMRLAALPIPDRTANWSANTIEYGSQLVAIFLNSQEDFGRAPSTNLPGLADPGAQ